MAEAEISDARTRSAQSLESLAELAQHIEMRRPGAVTRHEIAQG